MRVEGVKNAPLNGSLIAIANHESVLDGFVLASAIKRPLTFLSAAYLFEVPLVGWFLRKMGAIPVEKKGQNLGSLKKALEVLEKGGALGIFPEGGTQENDIYSGAIYLALKSGAPILPVAILGTDRALPPGRKLPRLTSIEVKIGKIVNIPRKRRITRKEIEKGTDLLQQILVSLKGGEGFCLLRELSILHWDLLCFLKKKLRGF